MLRYLPPDEVTCRCQNLCILFWWSAVCEDADDRHREPLFAGCCPEYLVQVGRVCYRFYRWENRSPETFSHMLQAVLVSEREGLKTGPSV